MQKYGTTIFEFLTLSRKFKETHDSRTKVAIGINFSSKNRQVEAFLVKNVGEE
jgi:ribosome-associated toxin RatA of RatAB toxin-antitoxin module